MGKHGKHRGACPLVHGAETLRPTTTDRRPLPGTPLRPQDCARADGDLYYQAMTGAHRREGWDATTVEGVRALLWLIGFIAVIGVFAYFLVTDWKDLPILLLALQAFLAATYAKRLVVKVVRNRTPTPVVIADWIGDLAVFIGWFVVVISGIGRQLGWMHGAFEYALVSIFVLFAVAMPVYWWRGQRRVALALTARSVAGRWPWSVGG